MVFLRLAILFWSSQCRFAFRWEDSDNCFDDSNKHWELWTILPSYPSITQLLWPFITTYKADHSHCDYNRRYTIIRYMTIVLYYSCISFWFEFETANQPGFEPGSPGLKAATLIIELHSIDCNHKTLFVKLYYFSTSKVLFARSHGQKVQR